MDKHMQQTLLKAEGLGVPDSIIVHEREWMVNKEDVKKRITKHFTFPVFTKPTREGSSVGVTGVKDEVSLERGIEDALKYDNCGSCRGVSRWDRIFVHRPGRRWRCQAA